MSTTFRNYIDGAFADASDGRTLDVVDPTTGAVYATSPLSGEADVDNEHKRVDMTMDLGMLGGEMEILMDDGVMYMRSPVFQDAGTDWVSMDPSKMDPAAAGQDRGRGLGPGRSGAGGVGHALILGGRTQT